jgi:pyruvate kinase
MHIRSYRNKTKIVCTIGPRVANPESIEQLICSGMNVARLNFSHGDYDFHQQMINHIREISQRLERSVAILQDLSGPKFRIGKFADDKVVHLSARQPFVFCAGPVEGDEHRVSFPFPEVYEDIKAGDVLLVADGALQLKVENVVNGNEIHMVALNDSSISSAKGVNFPDSKISVPALTQKDKKDLEFGLRNGVDFIALSFVRYAEDMQSLRNICGFFNKDIPLIAKIEKHEAIQNLADIVQLADGVMVARGDLGVEIPLEQVPILQKEIIHLANKHGKPVITATQVLRSMVDNPRPSRAEVSDIANAIWDGTDALMLSEETAIGNYPLEAVQTLANVAQETEKAMNHLEKRFLPIPDIMNSDTRDAVAGAIYYLSKNFPAKAIVTPTATGITPKLISRLQPDIPIVALTPDATTYRRLALSWGVFPYMIDASDEFEILINNSLEKAAVNGWLKKGDSAILAMGYPFGEERTDTIRLVKYE